MHGEVADVAAEDDLALGLQFRGDSVPALDDRPSRLEQPHSRRVGDRRRCAKLAYDAVELLAQRIGVSPTLGPVEHILGGSLRLTPHGPRGRMRTQRHGYAVEFAVDPTAEVLDLRQSEALPAAVLKLPGSEPAR